MGENAFGMVDILDYWKLARTFSVDKPKDLRYVGCLWEQELPRFSGLEGYEELGISFRTSTARRVEYEMWWKGLVECTWELVKSFQNTDR